MSAARRGVTTLVGAAGLGAAGVVAGTVLQRLEGNRMAPWILGRASGICAYLLLVGLVLSGLVLAHPSRASIGGSTPTRIRAHITLALFTAGFTALHVLVLATDRYAGVGWWGTVVPLGSAYRPAAVTLGQFGLWTGLLAGLTAGAAGRLPRRMWWPLHKVAAGSLVLIWLHGVLAGGDSAVLLPLYAGTGLAVLLTAVWRYTARRAAEKVLAGRP